MKKLHFILTSNEKEKINEVTTYFINNNVLHFKINETTFSYDIDKKIFIKNDNDTEIKINLCENLINITLLKNNYIFDMEVISSQVKISDKSLILEYSFESSEETKNIINIEYLD